MKDEFGRKGTVLTKIDSGKSCGVEEELGVGKTQIQKLRKDGKLVNIKWRSIGRQAMMN